MLSNRYPIEERQRRTHANPAVAMQWAGSELTKHARQVMEQVFERLGVPDLQKREDRIGRLFADMEHGVFRPGEEVEPIALSQGKVAINEQRERHADHALRHAVAVEYENEKILLPLTVPNMGDFEAGLHSAFQRMQASLLEAQRHLSALDILKNLEGKHYGQRAQKAALSRTRAASDEDQQTLLAVMVKNMLYKNADVFKRAQSRTGVVAHEWAVQIYDLNSKFEILNVTSLDDLQADIHTLLLKSLKAGKNINDRGIHRQVMARRLRGMQNALSNEEAGEIEAELAHKRGFCEGVQSVLGYLLEQRFGELPGEALEVIRSIDRIDDLQSYLDLVPEADSWKAVLRGNEPSL